MYGTQCTDIYVLHGMAGDHWMLYNRSVTNLNHQIFHPPHVLYIIIITNDHVRHNMWWWLCSINRQLVFAAREQISTTNRITTEPFTFDLVPRCS